MSGEEDAGPTSCVCRPDFALTQHKQQAVPTEPYFITHVVLYYSKSPKGKKKLYDKERVNVLAQRQLVAPPTDDQEKVNNRRVVVLSVLALEWAGSTLTTT